MLAGHPTEKAVMREKKSSACFLLPKIIFDNGVASLATKKDFLIRGYFDVTIMSTGLHCRQRVEVLEMVKCKMNIDISAPHPICFFG